MFLIAYAFKGQVLVFAGQVKIVSHSFCRTSAILKYFCPLPILNKFKGISSQCSHIMERRLIFQEQFIRLILTKFTWV